MSLLCSIPLAATLFSACAAPAPLAVGYVEGDYVLLAPVETAQVTKVLVRRGDRVDAGEPVATLESADSEIAVTEAMAALAQAEARLEDLKIGKRPEEIAVLEAAVRSAHAQTKEARRSAERIAILSRQGIATRAQLDEANTAVDVAEAQIGQSEASLAVARLPARPGEIQAASGQVEQAKAALEQAKWRLSKRSLTVPSPGRVSDVIRNPGDIAGPAAPVVSILPDGAVKLVVYVPQRALSSIRVSSQLAVHCDGCAQGLKARVSYVSPDPEFTPPVIYSLDSRQKLVYLVEARPEGEASALKPGQVVDVRLAADR